MRRRVQIRPKVFINLDSNLISCSNCMYRDPWKNYCKFFHKKLDRIGQRNSGFHHNRCESCVESEKKYDPLYDNMKEQVQRYYSWAPLYAKVRKEMQAMLHQCLVEREC